jgi:two-component SAPR family response regulator
LEHDVDRRCCLILEDQALIGLALEASLEEAGFAVAGPFCKSSDALYWLNERTPDLALIDVLLKDGTCLPVARELRKRSVPFAIYSGLKAPCPMAPEFKNVPWLEKPVARHRLSETLLKLDRQVSVIAFIEPARQVHDDGSKAFHS